MGGWKSKLIFLMVVYFAGFGTAIYTLAPSPGINAANQANAAAIGSALKTGEFTNQVNIGMHKFVSITKIAAQKTGTFIQQQVNGKMQAPTTPAEGS